MNLKSKKASLIILGLTALVCSRAFFAFLNDPEGPNLLIVVVLAAVIYALSWGVVHLLGSSVKGFKKLLLAIAVQVIVVFGFYFWLS